MLRRITPKGSTTGMLCVPLDTPRRGGREEEEEDGWHCSVSCAYWESEEEEWFIWDCWVGIFQNDGLVFMFVFIRRSFRILFPIAHDPLISTPRLYFSNICPTGLPTPKPGNLDESRETDQEREQADSSTWPWRSSSSGRHCFKMWLGVSVILGVEAPSGD